MSDHIPESRLTADHLANERTFLAWIRTSITIVGLGFVVGKFGVWLRFIASTTGNPEPPRTSYSVGFAVSMVVVGALLALLGAWRYRLVRQAIEAQRGAAAGGTVATVTAIVIVFAVAILVLIARTATG